MSIGSENLIKIVNELQDILLPLGISNMGLELPQIAVIGGQSAGKSSVLESFVNQDFLPRGNYIVTRRPLVLQLINNKDNSKSYGEFLHIPGEKFRHFNKIREEITAETEREIKDSYGISSKPINLKIYSPKVLDLTLVDLPGIARVALENQPNDIEQRIEDMILEYIEQDNCIILAVTAANQDLATSDALKLAKKVDPGGERTIGVLTKLDLMDEGTDAMKILTGKHLPLKRGYIGVVNRSQKDIDNKKNMTKALEDEQNYFRSHPSYKDIADRLGISYLQKYLNKELTKHIMKILPPLKYKFQTEFNELNAKLEELGNSMEDSEKDVLVILSETSVEFKEYYECSVGGKGVIIDITKLNGGAKINLIMNETFANVVNKVSYDENTMRREIVTAILNFCGAYKGIFTPDAAFTAVVKEKIEMFRKPSMLCVEWVYQELETIIKDCANKIGKYSSLKQMYAKLTLDHLRECKKKCKEKVDNFVKTEKSYLDPIHDDSVGVNSTDNSKPISEAQLLVSAQVFKVNENQIESDGSVSLESNQFNGSEQEMVNPDYMKAPVDQVKRLADSYFEREKMKFKEYIPKICIIEMIDSTHNFISKYLGLRVGKLINSIDDIIKGDPDEELRRADLAERVLHYREAIDIIERFSELDVSTEGI